MYEVTVFGNRSGQLVSSKKLKPGHAHIVLDMTPDATEAGSDKFNGDAEAARRKPTAYTGRLTVDGVPDGEAHFVNVPQTGGYWSGAETMDVGSDLGSAVSTEYTVPARFTGAIDKVVIQTQ